MVSSSSTAGGSGRRRGQTRGRGGTAFSCRSVLIKLPDLLTESSPSSTSSLFGESSVDGDTDELSTMASASIKHSSPATGERG